MRLKNVYVGFTKDGKERLLYKTTRYFDEIDVLCTVFIDLETNEVFRIDKVNENTLNPFKKVFNKRFLNRKKVIKVYKDDRSKDVQLKSLYYADVYKKAIGYIRKNTAPLVTTCIVQKEVDKDVLVERVVLTKNNIMRIAYNNLSTNELYEDEIGCSGYEMPYVSDLKKVDGNLTMPKKKVLELNYKKEL